MRDFKQEKRLGVSNVDLECLAYGYELKITIVTDDPDMMVVAQEFDVEIWGALRLLKVMVDNEFITVDKAKEITDHWQYLSDCPKNFHRDFKKLFPTLTSQNEEKSS